MAQAVYQIGEAETALASLYAARAIARGAEWRRIDWDIRTVVAVIEAEARCGLREYTFLSFPA